MPRNKLQQYTALIAVDQLAALASNDAHHPLTAVVASPLLYSHQVNA